jgi:uncharacterized protein YlxP (DUF503 family)
MVIAVARLELRMEWSHSLKEKRNAIRKIKDRTRARHDVRMAEVGGQDTWQSTVLGFALVGLKSEHLTEQMEQVVRFIESLGMGELIADERELFGWGEVE